MRETLTRMIVQGAVEASVGKQESYGSEWHKGDGSYRQGVL
jgi:hypothetical protein